MPEARSAPVTVPDVRARQTHGTGHDPLVMVTAYDAPGARIADAAGVDLILVGDSVANNVLGYEDTLQVTIDDMAHHTAAVARAKPGALVVADLPWMSYHLDAADTVRNAATLDPGRRRGVKLEGGRIRVPMVEALVNAEIPVMGHLGLTPQSVHAMGGFGSRAGATRPRQQAQRPTPRPWPMPGASPWCSRGCPRRSGAAITEALDVPDHRDRGRAGLRRPGPGHPRPAGPEHERGAEIRPALRRPGRRGHGGGGRLRRRRAVGGLPGRRARSYH